MWSQDWRVPNTPRFQRCISNVPRFQVSNPPKIPYSFPMSQEFQPPPPGFQRFIFNVPPFQGSTPRFHRFIFKVPRLQGSTPRFHRFIFNVPVSQGCRVPPPDSTDSFPVSQDSRWNLVPPPDSRDSCPVSKGHKIPGFHPQIPEIHLQCPKVTRFQICLQSPKIQCSKLLEFQNCKLLELPIVQWSAVILFLLFKLASGFFFSVLLHKTGSGLTRNELQHQHNF